MLDFIADFLTVLIFSLYMFVFLLETAVLSFSLDVL